MRIVDPEVALIVMVYVPDGVPLTCGGGLDCAVPPPQPRMIAAKTRVVAKTMISLRRRMVPSDASGRTKEAKANFTPA